ncbi:hypothetical protein O7622_11305 [Micromonospora sp. WMMD1076]|uniref:hypothetical protein n=1 Tax=Micromonospora sp. WMMD1076 TaxID=3016103 RepID=UPI00249AA0AC|nr:hypothetical protein [Micromonospora sp. WMMD1076]WFF09097.1 hypothetical protein O7622_11305 [Micromonospora sp. WMMD1076]
MTEEDIAFTAVTLVRLLDRYGTMPGRRLIDGTHGFRQVAKEALPWLVQLGIVTRRHRMELGGNLYSLAVPCTPELLERIRPTPPLPELEREPTPTHVHLAAR